MPVIGSDSPTSGVGADSEEPCIGVGVGNSSDVVNSGSGGVNLSRSANVALCAGCGAKIADRYYLLAVDRQWHSHCLKCCECKLRLDSELTCFARDGNIYCKEDYYRLFAVKRCARCHLGISANELVMRARDLVYHLHCFNCTSCNKALTKGEQFGMRDSMVYCRTHYETLMVHTHGVQSVVVGLNVGLGLSPSNLNALNGLTNEYSNELHENGAYRTVNGRNIPNFFNGVGTVQKGRPRKRKQIAQNIDHSEHNTVAVGHNHHHHHHHHHSIGSATLELMPNGSELCSLDQSDGGGGGGGREGSSGGGYDTTPPPPNSSSVNSQHAPRTKRMRTSFKHHQLRTMKSYFALNQNPDAKDLKQLAQKTGLSKRVLQVWFQNARAKWRRNMMRQENQSGDKGSNGDSCPGGMTDLNNSGSHLGGSDHPMVGTPTPLGDIPPGALTSESQSPPSLHFGDLY